MARVSAAAAATRRRCCSRSTNSATAGLTTAQLAALAAELGSDVPFFVYRSAAICRGRGEQVNPFDFGVKRCRFYCSSRRFPCRPLCLSALAGFAGIARGFLFHPASGLGRVAQRSRTACLREIFPAGRIENLAARPAGSRGRIDVRLGFDGFRRAAIAETHGESRRGASTSGIRGVMELRLHDRRKPDGVIRTSRGRRAIR